MVKSNVNISRLIIAVLVILLLISNIFLIKRTINHQIFLENTLRNCNKSLAYVFNRFHRDVFLTSRENLYDKEYISDKFSKTAISLYVWKNTMNTLERANPGFDFKASSLYYYISTLSRQGEITQEHLDRLDKINSLVKQLSTSNTASLNDQLEFTPAESVENSLREIGKLSREGLNEISH